MLTVCGCLDEGKKGPCGGLEGLMRVNKRLPAGIADLRMIRSISEMGTGADPSFCLRGPKSVFLCPKTRLCRFRDAARN